MAVEPLTNLIMDAIVDRLQTVDGTGVWNFDLSGSGTVYINERITDPNHSPCSVAVAPTHVDRERGSGLDTPWLKGRAMSLYVYCAVPGNIGDYETRLKQANRLGQDVTRVLADPKALRVAVDAIEANRSNAIVMVDVERQVFTGLADGKAGSYACIVTITFTRPITDGGI